MVTMPWIFKLSSDVQLLWERFIIETRNQANLSSTFLNGIVEQSDGHIVCAGDIRDTVGPGVSNNNS